jgi:hypothetical protein
MRFLARFRAGAGRPRVGGQDLSGVNSLDVLLRVLESAGLWHEVPSDTKRALIEALLSDSDEMASTHGGAAWPGGGIWRADGEDLADGEVETWLTAMARAPMTRTLPGMW